MAKTFVLAFTKGDDADAAVGEYSAGGYKIVRIEPTDRVELKSGTEASVHWKSGADADFILVIATKGEIKAG